MPIAHSLALCFLALAFFGAVIGWRDLVAVSGVVAIVLVIFEPLLPRRGD